MGRIERYVSQIRSLPGLKQLDKIRYKKIFSRHSNWNLFYGVYSSFEDAEKDIPRTKPIGYNHESAAKMYGTANQKVRLVDYPAIFWISKLLGQNCKLFDYGGHIGLRFYGYSRYLEFPEDFTWTVWDLPAILHEGEKIAAENNVKHLRFSDTLEPAKEADILLASGSLQYFEEPLYNTLLKLNIRPPHIIINGLPLHEKQEFVTINNMGTAFCTYKVFNKDSFIEGMEKYGYLLKDIWRNSPDKSCRIPFNKDFSNAVYYGMYFSDNKLC